jgi:hypothetical protein
MNFGRSKDLTEAPDKREVSSFPDLPLRMVLLNALPASFENGDE